MSPIEGSSLRRVGRLRRFRRVARSGYAINGLIHFLIGGVAIALAFGDSSAGEADQAGALQQLSNSPIGLIAIWAAVVGLLTLGLWQVTRAAGNRGATRLRSWGIRISESAKGLVYFALAASALVIALGGTISSSKTISRISTRLLDYDFGGWVLLVVGGSILGAGIGFVSIGIRRSFRKLIRVPDTRPGRVVVGLGLSGYIAKGLALGLTGVLFFIAAFTSDSDLDLGLDGSLRALGALPLGPLWLVLIGIGLIQYGLFLVARARLARL